MFLNDLLINNSLLFAEDKPQNKLEIVFEKQSRKTRLKNELLLRTCLSFLKFKNMVLAHRAQKLFRLGFDNSPRWQCRVSEWQLQIR